MFALNMGSDFQNSCIREVKYYDILKKCDSFVSLDISVRGTGWVKWKDGELSYGGYALEAKDNLSRRQEFKLFLKELFSDDEFDFVFVEDVIASCNFKTAKILIQLNPLVDDLLYDKEIAVRRIIREDNKKWKKNLRLAANFVPDVLKLRDKEVVARCLNNLGVDLESMYEKEFHSDIFDALGLAVGVIFRLFIAGGDNGSKRKLKTDILKGYNVKQFRLYSDAVAYANKSGNIRGKDVLFLNFSNESRGLLYNFKKAVEVHGDDRVFMIFIPTLKLGELALKENLDLNYDNTYLICFRK